GGADMALRLWDLRTGKSEEKSKKHGRGVTALTLWPHDRDWVLTGSGTGILRLQNVYTESEEFEQSEQNLRVQFDVHGAHAVRAMAVSPTDPLLVLTAGGSGARLFNIQTRELVMTLKADMGNVNAVAFLKDGKRVLTASQDGCVRLWNIRSGKELECFKGHT